MSRSLAGVGVDVDGYHYSSGGALDADLLCLVLLAALCFSGALAGVVLLFVYFDGCAVNSALIAVTLGLMVVATATQLLISKDGNLLASGVVCLYAVFVAYVAVSANPDGGCNPTLRPAQTDALAVWLGLGVTGLSLMWTALRASDNVTNLWRAPSDGGGAGGAGGASLNEVLAGGARAPPADEARLGARCCPTSSGAVGRAARRARPGGAGWLRRLPLARGRRGRGVLARGRAAPAAAGGRARKAALLLLHDGAHLGVSARRGGARDARARDAASRGARESARARAAGARARADARADDGSRARPAPLSVARPSSRRRARVARPRAPPHASRAAPRAGRYCQVLTNWGAIEGDRAGGDDDDASSPEAGRVAMWLNISAQARAPPRRRRPRRPPRARRATRLCRARALPLSLGARARARARSLLLSSRFREAYTLRLGPLLSEPVSLPPSPPPPSASRRLAPPPRAHASARARVARRRVAQWIMFALYIGR